MTGTGPVAAVQEDPVLTSPTSRRTLAALAVLAAAGVAALGQPPAEAVHRSAAPPVPAQGPPTPTPAAAPAPAPAPAPATLCAHAGTLKGEGGQRASVSLCVGTGGPNISVSAPARCGRPGSVTYACLTSGTWTVRRDGQTLATGPLPSGKEYPGPGTYDVSGSVQVRSSPAGVDLRGEVHATLTLTEPKAPPTHRIEVDRSVLRPNSVTLVTYTVARDSDRGDGSARLGIIGEESSGVELATSDPRCVNPLTGRYPSTTRSGHALDCALTDLQPGRPSTVVVQVSVKDTCSTVVSKAGYWMPQGQTVFTGGMLVGPTVTCEE
ncbi:hypothetical protein ACFYPC_29745 [Streptomyces sp. NPDC005808]|uniref:hypothetical protein n=1 Tax=Streptomyces sp. NPDC005808 TaxID=3364734 RepID=UPI003681CE49